MIITIASEAHRREVRRQHVGGSEVAALFGEHQQLTKFELWNRKKGVVEDPDLSENERVFWGQVLEPAIAAGVAQRTGWNVRKVHRYHSRRPDLALGASLDYEIVAHERGPGVLEIKTADWLIARNWPDGAPPLSYELQLQAYLAVTGRAWGVIGALIGGNDLQLFEYTRRPGTIQIIEREVKAFWASIAANKPPKPDWENDAETVGRLYASVTKGKSVDMSTSNRLPEVIDDYRRGAEMQREGEKTRDAARAEILSLIDDAEVVTCGNFRITASQVAATPDKTITADMVGTTLRGRSGYRNVRVFEKKR